MLGSRLRLALALLALLLVPGACGDANAADGLPDINYGRDVCVECGMIISEARFASAYSLPDGTEKVFDDIGGMLKHGHAHGEISTADAWVHDYSTEDWVAADEAYYIVTRSIATPMAFGIISFGDAARAEGFARDIEGEVVGWDVILQLDPDLLIGGEGDQQHPEMDMEDDDSEDGGSHMHTGHEEKGTPAS